MTYSLFAIHCNLICQLELREQELCWHPCSQS